MPAPISVPELQELLGRDPETRVIDVRTPGEYESVHIPGSYNVPIDQLSEHAPTIAALREPVVLVCHSGARAGRAGHTLAELGMENLHTLDGGIDAWERGGGPVRRIRARWSLERQIRLVAGSIVALAILASIAVPALKWVAFAIGAGLTFAAVTNTCAMGMLLAKLPYNRGTSACDIDALVGALGASRR